MRQPKEGQHEQNAGSRFRALAEEDPEEEHNGAERDQAMQLDHEADVHDTIERTSVEAQSPVDQEGEQNAQRRAQETENVPEVAIIRSGTPQT